ncbi:MAG: hypothetical protein EBY38_07060, partial [Flavobacteriaceae bacterium]|nr:hypothetical protein [Flavobacteriaceae bacterium]
RIKVLNNSKQEKLGLHHNWNFEKKFIYKNNQLLRDFPFVDSEDRPYIYRTDERIWYDYKIQMPVGEITEIFSYFRSQPLDRVNSRPGGIDGILIGTWEEIEFREMIRVSQYLIIVPVLFCFSLYFLCFFFVSKESSYLWIAIILAAVAGQSYPVIFDAPVGHQKDNRALPFGLPCRLTLKSGQAKMEFYGPAQ